MLEVDLPQASAGKSGWPVESEPRVLHCGRFSLSVAASTSPLPPVDDSAVVWESCTTTPVGEIDFRAVISDEPHPDTPCQTQLKAPDGSPAHVQVTFTVCSAGTNPQDPHAAMEHMRREARILKSISQSAADWVSVGACQSGQHLLLAMIAVTSGGRA